MISRIEVLPHNADQEDGDDIGEDHRDDAAGGGTADIVLQQRHVVDEVGNVGGGVTRPAAGGNQDLGEHREQEDGLDQDHHGDRPRQVRQDDVPEQPDE